MFDDQICLIIEYQAACQISLVMGVAPHFEIRNKIKIRNKIRNNSKFHNSKLGATQN